MLYELTCQSVQLYIPTAYLESTLGETYFKVYIIEIGFI